MKTRHAIGSLCTPDKKRSDYFLVISEQHMLFLHDSIDLSNSDGPYVGAYYWMEIP